MEHHNIHIKELTEDKLPTLRLESVQAIMLNTCYNKLIPLEMGCIQL
jgi:hypothetical protein